MTTPDAVTHAFDELAPAEQTIVQEHIESRMPKAPEKDGARTIIWVIVLLTLAGMIFLFGILGYLQIREGKPAEVLFSLATAAAGALVGLIGPSPVSR